MHRAFLGKEKEKRVGNHALLGHTL